MKENTKKSDKDLNFMNEPQFLFSKQQEERVDFEEKDLIRLQPYGLSLSNDTTRPFLILQDEDKKYSLPVAINELEAGVTLTQSTTSAKPLTTHTFSEKLLHSLDIEIERCIFVEIKGVHQFVRLYLKNHPRYNSLKFRADAVMSLCIHMKTPIFATQRFINRSKIMSAEMAGTAKDLAENPLALIKPHNYLM